MKFDFVIIGGGPAGLMAAEVALARGLRVMLCDAKPSLGRKILMAGKSGLNITKDEPLADFMTNFHDDGGRMAGIVSDFTPNDVTDWANGLGQEVFTGSSRRVFPRLMKASPLMRAWLARLADAGLAVRTRWRWKSGLSQSIQFETPEGIKSVTTKSVLFALGGGSWPRLGSDGAWVSQMPEVNSEPLRPDNMGFDCDWSDKIRNQHGSWIKNINMHVGDRVQKGEFIITKTGIEGGMIYGLSRHILVGTPAIVDLLPNFTAEQIKNEFTRRGKASIGNFLRKRFGLNDTARSLYFECRENNDPEQLKHLKIPITGPRPIEEAISTAGGVNWSELGDGLMHKRIAGTFFAGEMVNWSAPTGGYLMTGCLAMGKRAGNAAAVYINSLPSA